jgi:exopolysaccharide biosynthesis protein
MILVADGRQPTSIGLTIPETGALFKEFGAVQAMNLDGGSSTQLAVNGQLISNPSAYDPANPLRPREVQVSNALVIRR